MCEPSPFVNRGDVRPASRRNREEYAEDHSYGRHCRRLVDAEEVADGRSQKTHSITTTNTLSEAEGRAGYVGDESRL